MAGKFNARKVSTIPQAGEIGTNEWNDSLVVAGGSDGQCMTRDSASADGWKMVAVPSTGSARAAFASRPAAGTLGKIFFPTDAPFMQFDNGVSWDSYGPVFPLGAVTDPGTAINAGVWTSAKDGATMTGAGASGGANIRGRFGNVPATPWSLTMCFSLTQNLKAFQSCGLAFRDNSGAMHIFDYVSFNVGTSVANLRATKFNNPTTFNADYTFLACPQVPRYMRIADNGTSRICSWSMDGINFLTLHTIGRTDFLTTTQVGVIVGCENSALPNLAPTMSIHQLSF